MRSISILVLVGCTRPAPVRTPVPVTPPAVAPPVVVGAPLEASCATLVVEDVRDLPAHAEDAQLFVDPEGAAHLFWSTLTFPRMVLHTDFHHAHDTGHAWAVEDHLLPTDEYSNTFRVAFDGHQFLLAVAQRADDQPRTYDLYRGAPWHPIGRLEANVVDVNVDGTTPYAVAYGNGHLAIHRIPDRVESSSFLEADVPPRTNDVAVHTTDVGLVVDLTNNLHSTTMEPRLRISHLDGTPVTRTLVAGGPELGPELRTESEVTLLRSGGADTRIVSNRDHGTECSLGGCTRDVPPPFTTQLRSWQSKAIQRKHDVIVAGMGWTVGGGLRFRAAPPDSKLPDRWERDDTKGTGRLIYAKVKDHQATLVTTSLALPTQIEVFQIAVDAWDRVHLLIRETSPRTNPHYVRLGCGLEATAAARHP